MGVVSPVTLGDSENRPPRGDGILCHIRYPFTGAPWFTRDSPQLPPGTDNSDQRAADGQFLSLAVDVGHVLEQAREEPCNEQALGAHYPLSGTNERTNVGRKRTTVVGRTEKQGCSRLTSSMR